ncbi:hypothetical protein DICVIV_12611, partial [Dictyocaulus viviparus]
MIGFDPGLVLLRQLRTRVTRLHNLLFHSPLPPRETWHVYFRRVDRMDREFRDCFDNLESYAKGLPNQLPQIEPLNRLRAVFQEEQLDVQIMETIEAMIDCENWNEGNFQTYMYLGEFLRLQRRRPSNMVHRPLPCSYWSTGVSPHAQFESAFAQFQKELLKNKTGIFPAFLERTAVGSIVELRFGVLFEKQIVFTQKMLMVEHAGMIEHITFVAPHEEWSFCTDFGEKRIDLNKISQYTVYQKLSAQANIHLTQAINTQEYEPMSIKSMELMLSGQRKRCISLVVLLRNFNISLKRPVGSASGFFVTKQDVIRVLQYIRQMYEHIRLCNESFQKALAEIEPVVVANSQYIARSSIVRYAGRLTDYVCKLSSQRLNEMTTESTRKKNFSFSTDIHRINSIHPQNYEFNGLSIELQRFILCDR